MFLKSAASKNAWKCVKAEMQTEQDSLCDVFEIWLVWQWECCL
jgi:hypothetical protein